MKLSTSLLKLIAPLSVLLTLSCILTYLCVQQTFRDSANDLPIQMAEDAAAMLAAGQSPNELKTGAKVDLAKSLSPFLTWLDDQGQVLGSTAVLEGKTPVPPRGALEAARKEGRNCVTWQPARGVRSATCMIHFTGAKASFVVAGHSLRETQNHIAQIGHLILLGWIGIEAALILTSIGIVFWTMNQAVRQA